MDDISSTLEYLKLQGVRPVASNALIVARARERGVAVSCDTKGRIRLRSGGRSYYFKNGRTDLNSRLAIRCTRQKDVTSRLLRHRGVAAPDNLYFHASELARAWSWAEPVLPVVVKPADSSKGRSVFVGLNDHTEFTYAFEVVSTEYGGALVEAFVPGTEHRVLVVDGRVVAATRRVPAHVLADGTSTVAELVAHKNKEREDRKNPIHLPLTLDETAVRELGRQGLQPESVPKQGLHVFLRGTSNIHTGGDAVDATEDLSDGEIALVEQAARALPGLRLGGIDVLLPRKPGEDRAHILEINDNPMLSMHHFPWSGEPRDAASAVIDAMFPSPR